MSSSVITPCGQVKIAASSGLASASFARVRPRTTASRPCGVSSKPMISGPVMR